MRTWVTNFAGYRHGVNEDRIDRWLKQFKADHRKNVAARLLDVVDFIGPEQISRTYSALLGAIPGWHEQEARRDGRWFFVAYSGSAGKSGDAMLHNFRIANRLNGRKFDNQFLYKSQLAGEELTENDTIVFIDDFSGTGRQICKTWKQSMQELFPEGPKMFLMLIAAGKDALKRIETETPLSPFCGMILDDDDDFFAAQCTSFTADEKEVVKRYCARLSQRQTEGFGDSGYVLIFAHRAPNNSIPILHFTTPKWVGLFERHAAQT